MLGNENILNINYATKLDLINSIIITCIIDLFILILLTDFNQNTIYYFCFHK